MVAISVMFYRAIIKKYAHFASLLRLEQELVLDNNGNKPTSYHRCWLRRYSISTAQCLHMEIAL
jgi:hypothetical protein